MDIAEKFPNAAVARYVWYRLFKWERNPYSGPGTINLWRGYFIDLFPGTIVEVLRSAQTLENRGWKAKRRIWFLRTCQRWIDPIVLSSAAMPSIGRMQ